MKKTTIVIALIVWAAQICYAQSPNLSSLSPSDQETYAHLKKQQRNLNRAGAYLAGGGLVLTAAGLVVGITGTIETIGGLESENKVGAGLVMFYTGLAAMVGSIPCFVVAGSKKRKAGLLLKGETAQFNFSPNGKMSYAAVGIRVRL